MVVLGSCHLVTVANPKAGELWEVPVLFGQRASEHQSTIGVLIQERTAGVGTPTKRRTHLSSQSTLLRLVILRWLRVGTLRIASRKRTALLYAVNALIVIAPSGPLTLSVPDCQNSMASTRSSRSFARVHNVACSCLVKTYILLQGLRPSFLLLRRCLSTRRQYKEQRVRTNRQVHTGCWSN